MLKKLFLAAASSALLAGAAQAETIIVNDGGDFDGAGSIASNPVFNTAGFFGGSVGGTDVASANNAVGHRFTTTMSGITSAILTIAVAQEFTGVGNDFISGGNGTAAASFRDLQNLLPFATGVGSSTITVDLGAAGLLGQLNTLGFLDIFIGDDREIDFLSLALTSGGPAVPVPAALPLMASALIGGSVAMRRRRKTA